ncbi:transcription antitermination factor [Listeria monocytogenes]|nr:transcription antitermination factor [Listeria monocytogenes]
MLQASLVQQVLDQSQHHYFQKKQIAFLKAWAWLKNVQKLTLKLVKQLWSKKDHSLTFPVKWTKWTTTKVKRKSWLTCSDVKRQSKWISTKSKNFKMCNLYIICGGCFIREATKWTKQSRFIWNLNEKPIF